MSKMKNVPLNLHMQPYNYFSQKLKRTIKKEVLAATSRYAALFHHKALISPFCRQNTGEVGERQKFLVTAAPDSFWKAVLFPRVKSLSEERKVFFVFVFVFWYSHFQDNLVQIHSKHHQEKQNPLAMTNFVSGKGRDGRRTNYFLKFIKTAQPPLCLSLL